MGVVQDKNEIDNVAVLPIAGARGRVEVQGIYGIFYKIRQRGAVLKRQRGGWPIAMKNGQEARINAAGWLPGFQSLYLDGQRVYRFGEGVPLAAKILAFFPLVAIVRSPVIGVLIGLIFVFYSLVSIKSPLFSDGRRIVLPIMNTVAAVLFTIVIAS